MSVSDGMIATPGEKMMKKFIPLKTQTQARELLWLRDVAWKLFV